MIKEFDNLWCAFRSMLCNCQINYTKVSLQSYKNYLSSFKIQAITNGQVSNHSLQQSRYYFYHSPDSGSSEPPSNCSLHPAGTTACSLEYNNNGDAIMGCLSMKMDIQMLGHIDSANNWQTTVSSQ